VVESEAIEVTWPWVIFSGVVGATLVGLAWATAYKDRYFEQRMTERDPLPPLSPSEDES
jgi:hypothetical protein